jgi:ArsR family transcriptional regulator, virulence genes transcriptional regulator
MKKISLLNSKNLERAHSIVKTLGNKRRLAIACLLHDNERSVNELAEELAISQSALSQHLHALRKDKIVSTRRDGRKIYYRLASNEARAIIKTLHRLFCD